MSNQEKHHYVQKKYIAQWHNSDNGNQLSVFNHDRGTVSNSGANARTFWEKDYNVLTSLKEQYYLPERFTADIDDKGIKVIRKINELKKEQLDNVERSTIALYTSLQYLRTPRYREETDEFFNAGIGHMFRKDVRKNGGIKMTKEEILKEKPSNEEEKKLLGEIEKMSEEEFQSHVPSVEDVEKMKMVVSTEGHSKIMLKAPKHAKDIHEFHWTFFIASKGTSFVTSDNPCFTVSRDPKRPYSGLCSDYSVTVFPLSPSVLLYIDNSRKSHTEYFNVAPKKIVKSLNEMIVAHSYDCVVAKDKAHLANLLKKYKHRKNKKGKTVEFGEYMFTTLE